MFIVTVNYAIKPESRELFRAAILKNAAASLREEPGCRQFDVSFSEDGLKCFLYEKYDDEAAFAAHRATPHFSAFAAATQEATEGKSLATFQLAENPHLG